MNAALPVRLYYGAWQRNEDGYWIFQRKPSDLGFSVLVNSTKAFEGLENLIRERYNLKTETPLAMAYHPPEWMLEPDGTRIAPATVAENDDVAEMMSLRSWFPGLILCVSAGPEDVASFQFLMQTTFRMRGATFVFDGKRL